MTVIATMTGRTINFVRPDSTEIHLDDLAAGLSRHPRYTGQTIYPYTVAQHCLLVAELAPAEHRLHALLHDAPEAYMCDVPSPLKEAMRILANHAGMPSAYDYIESSVWKAVCRRFDISADLPEAVVTADRDAMKIEAPRLQPRGWALAHWDHARSEPPPALAESTVNNILGLEEGGRDAWMSAVVRELVRR